MILFEIIARYFYETTTKRKTVIQLNRKKKTKVLNVDKIITIYLTFKGDKHKCNIKGSGFGWNYNWASLPLKGSSSPNTLENVALGSPWNVKVVNPSGI